MKLINRFAFLVQFLAFFLQISSGSASTEITSIRHIKVESQCSFDEFTRDFEKQLKKLDSAAFEKLMANSPSSSELKRFIEPFEGKSGLMLFTTYNHGLLLKSLFNIPKKAITYVVGNPIFAAQMTKEDLRASLYAPLRVLVYADDSGKTRVEYDLPSSLFGQFGNDSVAKFSKGLDEKLGKIIAQSCHQ